MEDTKKLVVRMKVDCLWKEKADGGIPFFLYFFFSSFFFVAIQFCLFLLIEQFCQRNTIADVSPFKRQLDLRILLPQRTFIVLNIYRKNYKNCHVSNP